MKTELINEIFDMTEISKQIEGMKKIVASEMNEADRKKERQLINNGLLFGFFLGVFTSVVLIYILR